MTISNTSRTAGPFIGNGITKTFPFSYKVFSREDVLVAVTVTATGVETLKVLDADYSVTLNADQNNNPGGTITMVTAPPVGTTLAATSNIALVQSLDLTNQGGFYPKVINDALDRIVMNIQQLSGKIGNGLGVGMAAITEQALAALALVQQIGGVAGASLFGFIQAGAGAVPRTGEQELRQRFTVEQFGGVGNGVMDDTAAIRKGIAAVLLSGGGTLHFQQGKRYRITDTITIPSGVTLRGGDHIISTEFLVASTPYYNLACIYVDTPSGNTNTPAFLVNTSTGLSGFIIYYPGQVAATSAAPVVYGWAIATNTAAVGNIDNVHLENLLLVNPYLGISLDKAGRFLLRNIYGQPIKKGLFIDRVYDKARMTCVHFWTFFAALDTALGQWITANGRGIEVNRVDGLAAHDVLALGYQDGLWFSDVGNGGAWADFTASDFDGCLRPLTFQKVQKVTFHGGSGTTLNAVYPVMRTVGDIDGQVTFTGFKFYGGSNMAAIIRSATGAIQFDSCVFPSKANNGPDGTAIVNESSCHVHVNGCELQGNRVYGGETTFVNGVPLLPCNNAVALATSPNVAGSWSGGLAATSVAGGVQFAVTSAVVLADYALGNEVRAPGQYVLEFDAECQANSGMYVRIHMSGSSGDGNFAEVYLSTVGIQNYNDFVNDGTSKVHIRFPFYSGHYIEPTVLRVEAHTYAAGVNRTLTLRNITFHKPDPTTLKDASAQLVQGNLFAEPVYSTNVPRNRFTSMRLLNLSSVLAFDGVVNGNQIFYGIERPSIGSYRRGDRWQSTVPAVGSPKGEAVSVAPSTWVSEGNFT